VRGGVIAVEQPCLREQQRSRAGGADDRALFVAGLEPGDLEFEAAVERLARHHVEVRHADDVRNRSRAQGRLGDEADAIRDGETGGLGRDDARLQELRAGRMAGVGVTAEAAVIALYVTTFFNVFQHSNIRTPQWLGYIVQRPESHSVHHQRGVHAWNYSDLPLFDLLFGTLRNPKEYAPQQGFYDGASSRVGDLILWRDVASAPLGRDGAGAAPSPAA